MNVYFCLYPSCWFCTVKGSGVKLQLAMQQCRNIAPANLKKECRWASSSSHSSLVDTGRCFRMDLMMDALRGTDLSDDNFYKNRREATFFENNIRPEAFITTIPGHGSDTDRYVDKLTGIMCDAVLFSRRQCRPKNGNCCCQRVEKERITLFIFLRSRS